MENKELRKKLHIGHTERRFNGLPAWSKKWIIIGCVIVAFYVANIIIGSFLYIKTTQPSVSIKTDAVYVKLNDELDPDTDGISTADENKQGTNPFNRDTDNDHITDDGDVSPTVKDNNITEYHNISLKPYIYKDVSFRHENTDSYINTVVKTIATDAYTKFFLKDFKGTISAEKPLYIKDRFGQFVKVSEGKDVEEFIVFNENPENITSLGIGTANIPVRGGFLGGLLQFFLPKSGLLRADSVSNTGMKSTEINNSLNDTNYAKEVIKNIGDNRFNQLHNDPSYINYLNNKLNNKECVPVSILTKDREFIGFITGKYDDATYLLADESGNYICDLTLTVTARQLSDTQTLTLMESLEFEAGDLNSENARLVFLN